MKFVKSKQKFIVYYLVVNTALVMLLFMTFSSFPTHDFVPVKTKQAHLTKLDTTLEVQPDGNTIVTEKMTVRGAKSGEFIYDHTFSEDEGTVDESSIKLIDSSAKLTHEYQKEANESVLKLKVESAFVGDETITVQYAVQGLMKHLRDGQLFQFNPWDSKDVDVIDAKFHVVLPQAISPTIKCYTTGTMSQQYTKESDKTLLMDVLGETHRINTYELRLWDTKPIVDSTVDFSKTEFRSTSDVDADVQNQLKQAKLEIQKYQMFQDFLKIMYIIASAIITIIFGILLLTNLIETQSVKKYLHFDKAPSRLGPGSAGKIIQEVGFSLDTAIRAGVLYMAIKNLLICQKDRMSVQLIKKKDTNFDEIEEITALQKFLFADKNTVVLQKETKDLEMTSRKTLNFFNYRKLIETVIQEYHGNKMKHMHKKQNTLRYMKTEIILLLLVVIEMMLFFMLHFSGTQRTFVGYSIIEVVMVVIAIVIIGIIPNMYYFSQKDAISEVNFDELSEWQYFRTFLFNKKLVRDQLLESDEQWREFLMYATVFGADHVVLSAMKTACPEHYDAVMQGSGKMILDTPEGYFSYTVK